MDIDGMDYNTERGPLRMAEYGRLVERMVDFCRELPTRELRQQGAEAIIGVMDQIGLKKASSEEADKQRTLWDHLWLLGQGRLDIEWPYDDMEQAARLWQKPQPVRQGYGGGHIGQGHYGGLLEKALRRLSEMDEGPEKDELTRLLANHMKRCLYLYARGIDDDDRVASDLERLTRGRAHIDLKTFKFDKTPLIDDKNLAKANKKKK